MGNNNMLGITMIVVGLAIATGGLLVLVQKKPSTSEFAGSPSTGSASSPNPSSIDLLAPKQRGGSRTSEEKGEEFEKRVVKEFSQDYFKIKEWRGDKYVEGRYAESSENPDLEIEFRLKDIRASFAVECKWRRAFDRGKKPGVEWASERQIANYQRFLRHHQTLLQA